MAKELIWKGHSEHLPVYGDVNNGDKILVEDDAAADNLVAQGKAEYIKKAVQVKPVPATKKEEVTNNE